MIHYKSPLCLELDPGSTATTYSDGDVIGALMTLPAPVPMRSGEAGPIAEILTLTLKDTEQVLGDLDVLLFDESFTAPDDGDPYGAEGAAALRGVIAVRGSISPSDWDSIGSLGVATLNGVFQAMKVKGGNVYALIVARSSITYAQAGSLTGAISGTID